MQRRGNIIIPRQPKQQKDETMNEIILSEDDQAELEFLILLTAIELEYI